MISSVKEYITFLEEVSEHDIFLQFIPTDHTVHPAVSIPSLIFIKDIHTKKTYYFSFKHPDSLHTIDRLTIITGINNLKGQKWAVDKKSLFQAFHFRNLLDVDLFLHLKEGKTIDYQSHETMAHRFIYRTQAKNKNLNNVVPLLKHQETFDSIFEFLLNEDVFETDVDAGYLKENEIIVETLAELESNGIHVNPICFGKHFEATVYPTDKVFSQYNFYTATGRPSNRFENVNYAALNKENGCRKCFISRHGIDGKMVLIDYSAFHPRIICNLMNFELSVDTDIYKYLGEMYFGRDITEYDLSEIKSITMRQLYGGVEEQFAHIKYFAHLKAYIDRHWENFEKQGYVFTPLFKRRITNKHIAAPNPNKLFNYILQATETEIAIQALQQVNEYLRGRKTKAVLYTYDSILFDFHKEDGATVLDDVINIMKMGNRFPIKVYAGDSYDSVEQIYP